MVVFRARIAKLSEWLAWLSAGTIFAMCLLTTVDVALRRLPFGWYVVGTVEISQLLNVVTAFSVLGAVLLHGQHLAVSVVEERLPPRLKRVSALVNALLSLFLWGLISWKMWAEAAWAVAEQEVMFGMANIPVWPARIMSAVGSTVLALALIGSLSPKAWTSPGGGEGQHG